MSTIFDAKHIKFFEIYGVSTLQWSLDPGVGAGVCDFFLEPEQIWSVIFWQKRIRSAILKLVNSFS